MGLTEMNKKNQTQLVRVYHLPLAFDPKDLFAWLGKTYTIHRRSKKILILEMNLEEAGTLVKEKNSKVFRGQFVGFRFEDNSTSNAEKRSSRSRGENETS